MGEQKKDMPEGQDVIEETETETKGGGDPMMTGERAVKKSNNRGTPIPRGTKAEDIETGTPSYD